MRKIWVAVRLLVIASAGLPAGVQAQGDNDDDGVDSANKELRPQSRMNLLAIREMIGEG